VGEGAETAPFCGVEYVSMPVICADGFCTVDPLAGLNAFCGVLDAVSYW
jgi:hypothetical protein